MSAQEIGFTAIQIVPIRARPDYLSQPQVHPNKKGERTVTTRAIAICLVAVLSLNCASIIHQTTQQVRIDSKPSGAAVTVMCGDVFNDPKLVTPAVVTLHRKADVCRIKMAKDGFAERQLAFGKEMSALYLGNILIGGIIGLIVDAANGAMWNRTTPQDVKQAPDGQITVELEQAKNAPAGQSE